MAGKPASMQVTVEKLSPVLVELAIEVDSNRVREELDRAYKDLAKNARVRGFRPGKAPRQVLTQVYGSRIRNDVARELVNTTYTQAVAKEGFQAVGEPSIEPSALTESKPFSYKARVEVLPKIESVKYDGLTIKRPSTEVTEAVLTAELDRLRIANSTLEPVKSGTGAESGNIVTLDLTVKVDGEELEDAAASDVDVELGQGNLMEDLEKAILGVVAGGSSEATVQMPDGHPHPKMRGKAAQFSVTVKEIKARVLPVVDDEFAKDLGDYGSLEELKKSLTGDLEKRLKEQADNTVAERIVAELVKANPIDVPPSLVQRQSQVTQRDLQTAASRRGQRFQLTEEIRAGIHTDSVVKVSAGLLMAEIAKAESISIGDAEIEEGLKELAEQTGKNIAKLRAEYRSQQQREMLVGMILENKVLDIIESKSQIETES